MDLTKAMQISASGMFAQGQRVRVISENIANADSTSEKAGGDPYQRKVISFKSLIDRASGVEKVGVSRISRDSKTPFGKKYEPGSPAADATGYVKPRTSIRSSKCRTCARPSAATRRISI
jgi:flagellar basal-body rod protein FlgC